ncbi:MAG: response regulator [Nitrospirae bacterium]|uniref:ATP-binding response regulator n=1 Tax=Candidatus Magnetobacterium casense TaxID=1455061 RepID=UPI000695E187|nr:ATP-binding protein [Candidatus Magnetobacterium casensis]MBF0336463.1 response regulator [Nitrospirota bacterium]
MNNIPKTTILIAEDEWVIANDIEIRLQEMGYEVVGIVSTAVKAIARATELRPDLVLMDIKLDGEMDGIEAATHIYSRLHIPFVFLTAFSDKKTIERAKLAEPFGYLIKPFKERELQIAVDIALYKHKAEQRLRESQAWLATTFNSICDAVITTDTRTLVTYLNHHATSLTGWSAEAALHRPVRDVFGVMAEDSDRELENPAEVVLRTGAVITYVSGVLRPKLSGNCGRVYIEGSAAPIRDNATGDVVGVILLVRDITPQRQAMERMRLSERLAAIGRMAAGVAHEINTPLTGIIMFTSMMIDRLSADKSEDREYLELIMESSERCSRVVNGLLRFSSTITSNITNVDVNALILDLLQERHKSPQDIGLPLRKVLRSANLGSVSVTTTFDPEIGHIKADATQIEEVFINILTNAADAMEGTGQLHITTRQVACEQREFVEIEFTDTGRGIEEKHRHRMFEPFFTTKPFGSSTGLGMSISHGIVKLHGGEITFKSEPGRGTSFFIRLPK